MPSKQKLLLIAQTVLLVSGLGLAQDGSNAPDAIYDSLGSGVTAPRAVYAPDPQYTDHARKKKINGTVIVSMIVGSDGVVRDPKVIKSLDKELDKQALLAVSGWKFEPATKDGKPVAFRTKVETQFRIY